MAPNVGPRAPWRERLNISRKSTKEFYHCVTSTKFHKIEESEKYVENVISCQKRINDFSQQKGQTQETNPLAGLIQTLPGSSPPWTLLQVKSRQNYRNWFSLNFVCLLVEGQGSRVTSRGSRVYGRGSRVNGRGSRVNLSNLKPSLRTQTYFRLSLVIKINQPKERSVTGGSIPLNCWLFWGEL